MAQENRFAMVNTGNEGAAEPSRVDGASRSGTSVEYHTGESSGNYDAALSSDSSVYFSTRIQSMIENRGNFNSEVEFDIEYSRDHHWSELVDSDTDNPETRLANREHFEELRKHPEWGSFFKSVKVVVGRKINEGGQAWIYDAKIEFEDGRKSPDYGYYVVKVMKGDCLLEIFQRQWPLGMLCNVSKNRVKGPLMWIEGGTMIDNKFAFVMLRQWGDLRKLIDFRKQVINNKGPPFDNVRFMKRVMLCIARDMDTLHREYGIIHRDLKSSNVLLWSFEEEPDKDIHVKANVVDYECSMGVVGTGFWRAPEILQQLKDGVPASEVVFTRMADVYSFGMTCYEILTGRMPFEGQRVRGRDFDVVLEGNRPEMPKPFLPTYGLVSDGLEIWNRFEYNNILEIIRKCWDGEPSKRPSFIEIVNMLEMETGRTEKEVCFLANLLDGRSDSSLSNLVEILTVEKLNVEMRLRTIERRFSYFSSIPTATKIEFDREMAAAREKLQFLVSILESERARRDQVRFILEDEI